MPLSHFHPVVQSWFRQHVGTPTDAQRQAWPRIASGRHVLLTAPTGSGKTLAAFLWALDALLTGRVENGALRVLYVSPMRALNNDVRRNLLGPLAELRDAFAAAGQTTPELRVMTRSGDTPADERQRMVKRPPELLITTPESLNILLTSQRGRAVLRGIRTVILDEIHAVLGTKRGVHLITAVDRLVPLCGEFQRIALSATVHPLERVARWVGGFRREASQGDDDYRPRHVAIVRSEVKKAYAIEVGFPTAKTEAPIEPGRDPASIWPHVTREITDALDRNRATLVFANSKRMVEKLTRFVNADAPEQRVYSHHGALSREIRAVVEQRLKQGTVRGIVATNSLELGIDIGALDEVLLVQTPPSVSSSVQRIGRAGHGVGEISRATFVPLVSRDILDSAVVARAVLEGAVEPVKPVCGALDVLAQVLLSMTAAEPWNPDALLRLLRTSDPYHDLSRKQFDLVIDMLTGRYASARVRELRPLMSFDRVADVLRARRGSDLLVYMSGGTIPDRGYFRLRRSDSMALIGELDEEFVWERSVGDTFTLGVQRWRVEKITHNDVLVTPAKQGAAMAPFWRAESRDRSFELSEAIATFLERAELRLDDDAFHEELRREHRLRDEAVDSLVGLLRRQKQSTAGMLPHRHRIVLEQVIDPAAQGSRGMLVLHTLWGSRLNRPFAMALQAAWHGRHGVNIEVMQDDDCVVIDSLDELRAEDLFRLVPADRVEGLLRERLEHTGYFGARFREAAGRALLLPRAGFRQRYPLWLSRLKGKKLLAAAAKLDDFPLVLEAWRECLQDAFDLPALVRMLREVQDGDIQLATVTTATPSPFAASVTWAQTNQLMYEDDTPEAAAGTRLKSSLLQEIAFASHLRPRIPLSLAQRFERKLQRVEVGWAPRSTQDLLDWLVERVALPIAEWQSLCEAIGRDHGLDTMQLVDDLGDKIAAVELQPGNVTIVVAAESLPKLEAALPHICAFRSARLDGSPIQPARIRRKPETSADTPLVDLLAELLRFHGPVRPTALLAPLGLDVPAAKDAIESLIESQRVVFDSITEGTNELELCDSENLERMLRLVRTEARRSFEARPVDELPWFLAQQQALATKKRGVDGLRDTMEKLFGLPLSAELWESEVLPARVEGYQAAWLDSLLRETELEWRGCAQRKISFALEADRELFIGSNPLSAKESADLDAVFPHPAGRFGFDQLRNHTGDTSGELTDKLWALTWKGRVTNDGFGAVRLGIAAGFKNMPAPDAEREGRRGRHARWKTSRPASGTWYRIPSIDGPTDALEQDEIDRDRVRVLLDRWGVLFRELLDREGETLRWSRVFRTLRVMELSGEVVSGQFFEGVAGLQFGSPAALKRFSSRHDDERVVWMSAADPASPCGLGLEGLGPLPRRVAGNHIVLRGKQVVVVSEGKGRRLNVHLPPGDPMLSACFAFLTNLIGRQTIPVRCVTVEVINGQAAASSPYRPVLEAMFHVTRDRTKLKLMRRYETGG